MGDRWWTGGIGGQVGGTGMWDGETGEWDMWGDRRVSACLSQYSREDAWRASLTKCHTMHASLCHMTSGTFQGRYSAMFIASRSFLGARRVLYPSETA